VKQKIVVLVGLPGAGKSSWLSSQGIHAISTDQIRAILSDDATNQNIHARVFATARYLLRQRLAIGRPVSYVDATHLTPSERKPYIEIARRCGCEIEALFFDTPLEECIRRNAARDRVVPPDVIQAMAAKLRIPELSEGFTRINSIHADRSSDLCVSVPESRSY
jgi:predicted kinase